MNSLNKLNLITNIISKTKAILPLNQQHSNDITSILKMNSRFSIGSFHSIMTLKDNENDNYNQSTMKIYDDDPDGNNLHIPTEDIQKNSD